MPTWLAVQDEPTLVKVIEALHLKVEELAEVKKPDAVHPDAFWMDGVLIHRIEVAADGIVHVCAWVPADFSFSGIVKELRPFAKPKGPPTHPASP